jgi:alpha-ketoglutarate-dependent taurine dioxygenase
MRLLEAGCATEIDADLLAPTLARDGLVLIRQGSVGEVRALLDHWTQPVGHPHQSVEGLTVIAPRDLSEDGENEAGFTDASLPPHTDRSLHPWPPSVLATVMVSPARTGGSAVLVDGARVLTILRRELDEAAITSLQLNPMRGGRGPSVIEVGDGLARFRYRDDQVAGPHSAAGWEDAVAELRRLISATMESLHLAVGDGYLVHNHRFLHGRTAFSGSRRLVRLLAKVDSDHPYAWLNRGFPLASS